MENSIYNNILNILESEPIDFSIKHSPNEFKSYQICSFIQNILIECKNSDSKTIILDKLLDLKLLTPKIFS